MEKLNKAILFAVEAHKEQNRKNGAPYILHPLETAAIAATMTIDCDVLCASVLHDTVEDTGVTAEEIRREFGERTAELVASETEDKRRGTPPNETWRLRKEESFELLKETKDRGVKIMWLSDKLSNMRSLYVDYLKDGDEVWKRFNEKDKAEQEWYYRTISELLGELGDTAAWVEYTALVNKIFKADTVKE